MKELRAVVSDEEFAEVERFAQGLGVSMGEQNGVRTRREGVMGLIETYQQYRNAGRELNQKIMNQCLEPGVIKASARLLGLAEGETIVFESDREPSVLMDFALHEYRVNNQNAIERYAETVGGRNDMEHALLVALRSSYTSLFKVIAKDESTLLLNDRLRKQYHINLVDISLIKTAHPGLLLFTRLVPLKVFNMTSGVVFVFRGDVEHYLVKQHKKLEKKVKSESGSIKRFVAFFQLQRANGMDVRYA